MATAALKMLTLDSSDARRDAIITTLCNYCVGEVIGYESLVVAVGLVAQVSLDRLEPEGEGLDLVEEFLTAEAVRLPLCS